MVRMDTETERPLPQDSKQGAVPLAMEIYIHGTHLPEIASNTNVVELCPHRSADIHKASGAPLLQTGSKDMKGFLQGSPAREPED